jgi:predicted nucleic acid-binding protein
MPAADRFFADTNLLLYSVDGSQPEKQEQARRWLAVVWEAGAGRLSWQVLHEFYANAERKTGLAPLAARRFVETFVHWRPVEMSLGLIQQGWRWMDQAQISYWDSLIVAAAERLGCAWLLSEDFQTGRRFDSVTVVNPFRQGPGDFSLPPRRR